MGYINFSTGFNITSTDAIDKRLVMTKADMLAVKKAKMPDLYFVLCSDDKQFYVYDKTVTPSAETGLYVIANKDILDRLSAAEEDIGDLNTAVAEINTRLANEFVTKDQMSAELPGAIAKALQDPTTKTSMEASIGAALPGAISKMMESEETKAQIEEAVAKTIPGALEETMSTTEGAQKVADALFDSEQFNVNVDNKIELQLDEAIQCIQAIDGN